VTSSIVRAPTVSDALRCEEPFVDTGAVAQLPDAVAVAPSPVCGAAVLASAPALRVVASASATGHGNCTSTGDPAPFAAPELTIRSFNVPSAAWNAETDSFAGRPCALTDTGRVPPSAAKRRSANHFGFAVRFPSPASALVAVHRALYPAQLEGASCKLTPAKPAWELSVKNCVSQIAEANELLTPG
jgi:hypothetical protein